MANKLNPGEEVGYRGKTYIVVDSVGTMTKIRSVQDPTHQPWVPTSMLGRG